LGKEYIEKQESNTKLQTEEISESRSIYQGRVVSLSLDTVKTSDGKIHVREKVHHPGAVAIVPVDQDGNVVMIRQYRHSVGKVLWEIPAGKLEPGEEPADCARRELAEETGYWPEKLLEMNRFYTAPGFASEIIHLFFAQELRPFSALQDEDESIAVNTLTMQECKKMIINGSIEDAKTIIGILMVDFLQLNCLE
jgi:ADP-ribose pyrophosphatase